MWLLAFDPRRLCQTWPAGTRNSYLVPYSAHLPVWYLRQRRIQQAQGHQSSGLRSICQTRKRVCPPASRLHCRALRQRRMRACRLHLPALAHPQTKMPVCHQFLPALVLPQTKMPVCRLSLPALACCQTKMLAYPQRQLALVHSQMRTPACRLSRPFLAHCQTKMLACR